MEQSPIDSQTVLRRIQQVIKEAVTPAWVTNPPAETGLPRTGTLKADHWRTLFAIHVPLALLSLWKKDSPLAAQNADSMSSVLSTSMHLTCASLMMTKNVSTPSYRMSYRNSLRQHVIGLKRNFPGFLLPSHHNAFHIYDIADFFSTTRNWWCFPFENLVGKLQRMPNNHHVGTLERSYHLKLTV